MLPDYLRDAGGAAAQVAGRLEDHTTEAAASLAPLLGAGSPAQLQRVLAEVAENFLRFQLVAQREADQQAELGKVPEVVVTVPYLDNDVYDLAGLLALGGMIWG